MIWWHDDMMTRWDDERNNDMMTQWHDDTITWWHEDMMTWWHDDTMIWQHEDMMTRWHDDMVKRWHDESSLMTRWWHDDNQSKLVLTRDWYPTCNAKSDNGYFSMKGNPPKSHSTCFAWNLGQMLYDVNCLSWLHVDVTVCKKKLIQIVSEKVFNFVAVKSSLTFHWHVSH